MPRDICMIVTRALRIDASHIQFYGHPPPGRPPLRTVIVQRAHVSHDEGHYSEGDAHAYVRPKDFAALAACYTNCSIIYLHVERDNDINEVDYDFTRPCPAIAT